MIQNLILTESGGKLNIIEFQGSKIFISSNKVIEKTVQEMIKQR